MIIYVISVLLRYQARTPNVRLALQEQLFAHCNPAKVFCAFKCRLDRLLRFERMLSTLKIMYGVILSTCAQVPCVVYFIVLFSLSSALPSKQRRFKVTPASSLTVLLCFLRVPAVR